ncbi:hypothetical protein EYF80_059467 [Liparis tanakae]|uniref:Uncharacterized protein n=1 Tax=Liparis tanakae TaxID=230148 RepID=A0A4Z2EPA7_9TELE|nr:hypothetical protein EYF80_059467 [Liparis tanakae]
MTGIFIKTTVDCIVKRSTTTADSQESQSVGMFDFRRSHFLFSYAALPESSRRDVGLHLFLSPDGATG